MGLLDLSPELLQDVLIDIPSTQLLAIQRVCRTLRNAIQASPVFRYDLYLSAPPPTFPISPPVVNPFLDDIKNWYATTSFADHSLTSPAYFMRIYIDPTSTRLDVRMHEAWAIGEDCKHLISKDSRMKMLLSQPSLPGEVWTGMGSGARLLGQVGVGARFEEVVSMVWEDELLV